MKFHDIDAQGNVHIHRVSTIPAWASGDEGRIIYAEDNDTLYYATASAWVPLFIFKTISVSGQDNVVADNVADTLTLVAGTGITITTNAEGDSITFTSGYNFGTISVTGQDNVVSDTVGDTLTLASGNSGIAITTNATTDTVTFTMVYGGTAFPSTPTAGMLFYRTDLEYWYMRNAGNTSWIPLFTEDRPPLDKRDGGTFSADLLDGYHYTTFASNLDTSGSYIRLRNPDGTVLAQVIAPYVTNADTVDGYHASSFASAYTALLQRSTYYNYISWRTGSFGTAYVDTLYSDAISGPGSAT